MKAVKTQALQPQRLMAEPQKTDATNFVTFLKSVGQIILLAHLPFPSKYTMIHLKESKRRF
jgi:hypothetical protein